MFRRERYSSTAAHPLDRSFSCRIVLPSLRNSRISGLLSPSSLGACVITSMVSPHDHASAAQVAHTFIAMLQARYAALSFFIHRWQSMIIFELELSFRQAPAAGTASHHRPRKPSARANDFD
jgi:hypothetical protein